MKNSHIRIANIVILKFFLFWFSITPSSSLAGENVTLPVLNQDGMCLASRSTDSGFGAILKIDSRGSEKQLLWKQIRNSVPKAACFAQQCVAQLARIQRQRSCCCKIDGYKNCIPMQSGDCSAYGGYCR